MRRKIENPVDNASTRGKKSDTNLISVMLVHKVNSGTSIPFDRPSGGLQSTHQHIHQCCLPRTVFSQEHDARSAINRNVDFGKELCVAARILEPDILQHNCRLLEHCAPYIPPTPSGSQPREMARSPAPPPQSRKSHNEKTPQLKQPGTKEERTKEDGRRKIEGE